MLMHIQPNPSTGQWGIAQMGDELYAVPPCCLSTANVHDGWYRCVSCGKQYALRTPPEGWGGLPGSFWETKVNLSHGTVTTDDLVTWITAWTGMKVQVQVD